jgi:hypothetical protein
MGLTLSCLSYFKDSTNIWLRSNRVTPRLIARETHWLNS